MKHAAPGVLEGVASELRAVQELRRRSSLLRAERCAVVMTDRDDAAAEVRTGLYETDLVAYRTTESEETIRTARAPFVRLFVIDARVPDALDAVRVVAGIREDLTPAPVLVGGADPEMQRAALGAGAAATFPAPLDIAAFRAEARRLLGLAG